MSPQDYCKQKTKESHSSFLFAFLFLSPKRRNALTALYAFCREVDDIADECEEYDTGKKKLDWWRLEIDRMYNNKPQHPVTNALKLYIADYELDKAYFIEIIDGMEMDLNFTRYESFKQLHLYCYRVASTVGILSAQIFGYKDSKTLKYAHNLGIALQLTNIIRDIGEDARRGRIYIPLDELKKFNTDWKLYKGYWLRRIERILIDGKPLIQNTKGRLRLQIKIMVSAAFLLINRMDKEDCDLFSNPPQISKIDWLVLFFRCTFTNHGEP